MREEEEEERRAYLTYKGRTATEGKRTLQILHKGRRFIQKIHQLFNHGDNLRVRQIEFSE